MTTLSIKGFSIIRISLQKKKLIDKKDYGNDKESFYKAIQLLLKTPKS